MDPDSISEPNLNPKSKHNIQSFCDTVFSVCQTIHQCKKKDPTNRNHGAKASSRNHLVWLMVNSLNVDAVKGLWDSSI